MAFSYALSATAYFFGLMKIRFFNGLTGRADRILKPQRWFNGAMLKQDDESYTEEILLFWDDSRMISLGFRLISFGWKEAESVRICSMSSRKAVSPR